MSVIIKKYYQEILSVLFLLFMITLAVILINYIDKEINNAHYVGEYEVISVTNDYVYLLVTEKNDIRKVSIDKFKLGEKNIVEDIGTWFMLLHIESEYYIEINYYKDLLERYA